MSRQELEGIELWNRFLCTMRLRDISDVEVERLRKLPSGTGDAVAHAHAAAKAARASGTVIRSRIKTLAKPLTRILRRHAYDIRLKAVKRAAQRRDRVAYNSINDTIPAEVQDHRRRRVGTSMYRAPLCGLE